MNARYTIIALVLVIAVGVAVTGAFAYTDWRGARGQGALAAAQLQADPAATAASLAEVARSFGATPAGREAMALLGNAASLRGDIDEAIRWFSSLEERARGYPMLRIYALHRMGVLLTRQELWHEAAAVFERAARIKGNIVRAASLYEQARCLEHSGDRAGARALYEELVRMDEPADAHIRSLSEERLLWLAAHHTDAA